MKIQHIVSFLLIAMAVACRNGKQTETYPLFPEEPSRTAYEGFTWEKVSGAGIQLWAQRNPNIHIVLDDNDTREGSYFVQAASTYGDGQASGYTIFGNEKIENSKIVQDAIIATYNNTGTIILGQGTTLKNYGGMSAVRVSGGKLIMEDGSSIVDGMPIDRSKGKEITHDGDTENFENLYGPAGAIWVQGGEIQIDNGAFIGGSDGYLMEGRAFYMDGGSVSVDGEIANIDGSNDMWNGGNGIIMHLRNGAEGVLEANAHIRNIQTQQAASENNVLFYSLSCDFKALSGSLIENCTNVVIHKIDYSFRIS